MIYAECCIFESNKMTVMDCLSVNNKNVFRNPVLNFAFGGQVTCNLVTQTVQFPTEAVTQSADTEQCGKCLDWHTVSSLRSITKDTDSCCANNVSVFIVTAIIT